MHHVVHLSVPRDGFFFWITCLSSNTLQRKYDHAKTKKACQTSVLCDAFQIELRHQYCYTEGRHNVCGCCGLLVRQYVCTRTWTK